MSFDPSKISLRTIRRCRETNPEKIFESLTLRGTVENLWSPQATALRDWDERRASSDVVIEMNTGGGKTLVGLLVAQSLVNETSKPVLYVCPTNQLVEQVASKAHECGIEVATYMTSQWGAREVTEDSRGPCLTNYAAVFNGKSIFEKFDLGGIIFDDAHAAGNIIRSAFSLTFKNGTAQFKEIVQRLRPYFVASHQSMSLRDAVAGDPRALLFVPMFEARRFAPALAKLLLEAKVDEETETKFAWKHIQNHLDRCVILLSGSRVEITPATLPLHRLRCLAGGTRRVYLTATLPSSADFVKTFGVAHFARITPKGKSGEAQRLFVFPAGRKDDEHRAVTKQLIGPRKACIIVPSKRAATDWQDVATLFDGSAGQAGIQRFAKATGAEKLILAARYDGIDLPGDACRVLVLDGLPKGSHLLTRFLDEALQVASLRASHSAIRVVQAIGRIFRSNTDHGAVVLCGTEVQGWARSPTNQGFLPQLLQKQVQLGVALRESVEASETTNEQLLEAVLSGDKGWDQFYQQKIDGFEISASTAPPSCLVDFAAHEQRAYQKLWEGNAADAASDYASLADDAEGHDARFAAWFRHWEGFAYDLLDNATLARKAYVLAANVRGELGRPKTDATTALASATVPKPTPQAKAIAQLFEGKRAKLAATLDTVIANLAYGDQTNPVEEALRVLGTLLGLNASRPDNDAKTGRKTGPDVKWHYPPMKAGAALEAKTNKRETSQYQKKEDIGQFHDHVKYLATHHPKEEFRKLIVGRHLRVTPDCHPPDDLRVVTLEQFHDLAERVRMLYHGLLASDSGESVEVMAERWLYELGLQWPLCVDGLQSKLAVDLQAEEIDGDATH